METKNNMDTSVIPGLTFTNGCMVKFYTLFFTCKPNELLAPKHANAISAMVKAGAKSEDVSIKYLGNDKYVAEA